MRYNHVRRHLLLILFIILSISETSAQYDVSFGHYWAMEPSFNPATAGKDAKLNVAVAYALQMAGFEHNPNTMYAGADMPFYVLGAYHGVGLQFMNDAIGAFTHKRFGLQYAFMRHLLGGKISIGAQATMISENLDGSKLDLADPTDPAFTTSSVNGSGFDLSLGLYYQHRNWYVGLSALHLNSPKVELGETNELNISPTYYFTGGYNIRLTNPFLTIQTSVLGRTDGVAFRGDVTARLKYEHEKTSAISIGNGSHEIFVGYQTDLNLYKKEKNLHKSVRIL